MKMNDDRFQREMMYHICLSLFGMIEDMTEAEKNELERLLREKFEPKYTCLNP